MKLTVDKDAKEMIDVLCDMALKVGGLNNLDNVNKLRANMTIEKEKPDVPDGEA